MRTAWTILSRSARPDPVTGGTVERGAVEEHERRMEPDRGDADEERGPTWVRPGLRISVVILGASHALAGAARESMNEDGISYLDMGEALVRADWSAAVNAVWSPLYPAILGAAVGIGGSSPQGELGSVHAANFFIFVLALLCFEWFWFGAASPLREPFRRGDRGRALPPWGWAALGYGLFAWTTLVLIRVWSVTPDLLLAALLFLAGGLLLRIGRRAVATSTWAIFGGVLAVAYLAKAVMFPLAFVFLAVAFLLRPGRRAATGLLVGVAAFILLAGPWVTVLSVEKGRFTFGEAGRLTYLRYVHDVPYPHWRPEAAPETVTAPKHPTEQIFRDPDVFAFASPVAGTYPPGYDPSYWYEGVSAPFEVSELADRAARSLPFYFELFVERQGGLVAAFLLVFTVAWGSRRAPGRPATGLDGPWRPGLGLVAVVVAALAGYALVYVEGRYVGAFLVLLWAGLLGPVRVPDTEVGGRVLGAASFVGALFLALQLGAFHATMGARVLEFPSQGEPEQEVATGPRAAITSAGATDPTRAATAARLWGLGPADRIAFVGYAFGATFARLADLRIVAEVPWSEAPEFWALSPDRRAEALQALARAGARAVVAEERPRGDPPAGWERMGGTHYLVRPLPSDEFAVTAVEVR